MAIPTPITDALIQECMVRAVDTVFKTMAGHEVRFIAHATNVDPYTGTPIAQIIGNVGFGGKINGLVYLCMPEEYARVAAGKILGMDQAELLSSGPEVVTDAIGEVTNMTVGNFKNALADHGYPCKLTVPTIVRGKGLSVNGIRGTLRHIYHFECMGSRISADLHMQPE